MLADRSKSPQTQAPNARPATGRTELSSPVNPPGVEAKEQAQKAAIEARHVDVEYLALDQNNRTFDQIVGNLGVLNDVRSEMKALSEIVDDHIEFTVDADPNSIAHSLTEKEDGVVAETSWKERMTSVGKLVGSIASSQFRSVVLTDPNTDVPNLNADVVLTRDRFNLATTQLMSAMKAAPYNSTRSDEVLQAMAGAVIKRAIASRITRESLFDNRDKLDERLYVALFDDKYPAPGALKYLRGSPEKLNWVKGVREAQDFAVGIDNGSLTPVVDRVVTPAMEQGAGRSLADTRSLTKAQVTPAA